MFLNSRLLLHARSLKALYVQPHATLPSQPYLQCRRTFTAVDPSFASTAPVMPPPSAPSGRLHANQRRLQHCKTEFRSSSRINSNRSSNDRMLTTVHDLRFLETVLRHREISAAPAYAEAAAVETKAEDASAAASGRGRVVVLLLNRPFPSYVHCLLENASLVVAADGAANHMLPLYRAVEAKQQQQQQQQEQEVQQQQQQAQDLPGGMKRNALDHPVAAAAPWLSAAPLPSGVRTLKLPACICGDLDSSTTEALSFFQTRGVPVVRLPDQSQTDLEKAFAFAANKYRLSANDTVIITGAIGGRFDHSIAAVSFLYKVHNASTTASQQLPKVVLLGGYNACVLLLEGDNMVLLSNKVFSETCGLLPMAGKVRSVTTEGLQWDVRGEPLFVGGLISSSNVRVKDRIKIATSDPLVFFGELNKDSLLL